MKENLKKVVFSQPWGGLGDNLCSTNLPRLYNEINCKFYISYLNYSRNKDIHDICWNNNEFVLKSKKFYPNIGFKKLEEKGYKIFDDKYNVVQNVNVTHGFAPGEGYPEINIQKYVEYLNIKNYDTVIDTKAYSIYSDTDYRYSSKSLNEKINYYRTKDSFDLIYPHLYQKQFLENDVLEVSNLSDLINILLNTKNFICLNSGSHVLAATLNYFTGFPKNIYSFNNVRHFDAIIKNNSILNKQGLFYFENVNYENIEIIENKSKRREYDNQVKIDKTMRKNINIHRRLFYYEKRIKELIS